MSRLLKRSNIYLLFCLCTCIILYQNFIFSFGDCEVKTSPSYVYSTDYLCSSWQSALCAPRKVSSLDSIRDPTINIQILKTNVANFFTNFWRKFDNDTTTFSVFWRKTVAYEDTFRIIHEKYAEYMRNYTCQPFLIWDSSACDQRVRSARFVLGIIRSSCDTIILFELVFRHLGAQLLSQRRTFATLYFQFFYKFLTYIKNMSLEIFRCEWTLNWDISRLLNCIVFRVVCLLMSSCISIMTLFMQHYVSVFIAIIHSTNFVVYCTHSLLTFCVVMILTVLWIWEVYSYFRPWTHLVYQLCLIYFDCRQIDTVPSSVVYRSMVNNDTSHETHVGTQCVCNHGHFDFHIDLETVCSAGQLKNKLHATGVLRKDQFIFHGKDPVLAQIFDPGRHCFSIRDESKFGFAQTNDFSDNDTFSVFFQNVDGLGANTSKKIGLKMATLSDTVVAINEANLKSHDRALLVNEQMGDQCIISSLDTVSFKNGKRVKVASKKSGYGTALLTKGVDTKYFYKSEKQEIVACNFVKNGVNTCFITFYRSPSSTVADEQRDFYSELDSVVARCFDFKPDLVLLKGDDNSHQPGGKLTPAKNAGALLARIAEKYRLKSLINGQPTRKALSPDSALAWFNDDVLEVKSLVVDSFFNSDHRSIRTFVSPRIKFLEGVKPKFKPKVGHKPTPGWDAKKEASAVRKELSPWLNYWKVHPRNEANLDRACAQFIRILDDVKRKSRVPFIYHVPVSVVNKMSHDEVEIEQLKVKLFRAREQSLRFPNDGSIKARISNLQDSIRERICILVERRVNKDLQMQGKLSQIDPKRWWHNNKGLLATKTSFNNLQPENLTEEAKEQKLIKNDMTYMAKPGKEPDYDSYKDIAAVNKYELNMTVSQTEDLVRGVKKVDVFYRNNAKALAPYICFLINWIGEIDHFPKCCRRSKLTFLPSRAIFSLEALPKIFETAMKRSFDVCFDRELAKFDPGNMAYRKNAGVVLTTFLTFQAVETCDTGVVQTFQDAVKAFNACSRTVVVAEYQRVCGAGKLMKSWFQDRVYLYDGKERGHDHNRGVGPGTLCGVDGFTLFVNTNDAMISSNEDVLEVAKYSDDDSPCFSMNTVANGRCQATLDRSFAWMTDMGGDYHLSGDKAPVLMCYLKKGQEACAEVDLLTLGGAVVKRVHEQRFLGVNVVVRAGDGRTDRCIDKYGYRLCWPLGRLRSIAYRFQAIKDKFQPRFMRMMVNAYFSGLVRFAASMYFSRGSMEDRKTLNFLYCMTLSACLGLSAAETVGLGCCANQKVADQNPTYLRMCRDLKMPTIHDMAVADARALAKQAFLMRPALFSNPSRSLQKRKYGLPGSVAPWKSGTLVDDILRLAKKNKHIDLSKPKDKEELRKEKWHVPIVIY